ncbi:MAG: 16S rRNA (cytosine(967)-C(5))-methyltransferase RsmB [Lentisphaerae bacterium]|nr:16S rRNA (cytosine(967)-C(5))-methyltransferase RsmB [Lentisphaerota bacterium]
MPGNKNRNSRAIAATAIRKWLDKDLLLDRVVEDIIDNRAFVSEVAFGVARHKRMLDWAIRRCANRTPSPIVVPFLLVGIYQIFFMDSVPAHSAVDETVKAVKADRNAKHASGFVNALLRRVLRELDNIRTELANQALGVRMSHPDVLLKRWLLRFGDEKTNELCSWNNSRPEISIRPNMIRTNTASLLNMLNAEGIAARFHPNTSDEFIMLPRGHAIASLPGFNEGLFSVQDPSTAFAVKLLDPQPGEHILDACAAPGGKTILIAERLAGNGAVIATDSSDERLLLLQNNAARMGFANVRTARVNASDKESMQALCIEHKFDRILLDVPCTNTGVLRRRPDARWRFSEIKLRELTHLQRNILNATSGFVRAGGTIVYSTCSLEPEEGSELIADWTSNNPGFALTSEISIFPPESQTDGIYAAALRRIA